MAREDNRGPDRSPGTEGDGRLTRRILLASFVAALIVRAVLAWASGAAAPQEIRYISIAQGLLAGRGFEGIDDRFPDIIQPPALPLLIALGIPILRDPLLAARGITLLMGSLLVFPVGALTRRIFGHRAARRAAWVVAIYPLLAHISGLVMTESTFGLLVAIAALLYHRMGEGEGRTPTAILAGALLGLSFLTRPEGATYLAAGSLLLFVLLWRSMGRTPLRALGLTAVPIVTAILCIAPYTLWLHAKTDRWLLAPKGVMTQIHNRIMTEGLSEGWEERYGSALFYERVKFGLNEQGTELRSEEAFRAQGLSVVPADRAESRESVGDLIDLRHLAGVVVRNLRRLYLDTIKYGLVIPTLFMGFIALGMTARPWRRGAERRGPIHLLWWTVAGGSWALTYIHPRFLYSSLVFIIPWIGIGWVRLEEWLSRSFVDPAGGWGKIWERVGTAVVAAVVAVAGLIHVWPPTREISTGWIGHRSAGIWLGTSGQEPGKVMALTSVVAFYAGMDFDVLPYADLERVVRYARLRGVKYLIVDRKEYSLFRPQLLDLTEPEQAPPGLQPILVMTEQPDRKVLIYRVSGDCDSELLMRDDPE